MRAEVVRNRETGMFAAMLGSYELAKGKSGPAVARVHDIVEEVNAAIEAGLSPQVATEGRGAERRFSVIWGDAVLASGMSATGAYRILDGVEGVLEAQRAGYPDTPLGEAVAERLRILWRTRGPWPASPAMSEKIEADLQAGESPQAEPAADEDPFSDGGDQQ